MKKTQEPLGVYPHDFLHSDLKSGDYILFSCAHFYCRFSSQNGLFISVKLVFCLASKEHSLFFLVQQATYITTRRSENSNAGR